MGTGYTRKDTADNISDGNIINASDLDLEFDGVQAAFDSGSGHTHDGTAGEGAPIEVLGPNQEIIATATVLRPAADNTVDLGVANTNEFKNLYIDGTAYLDSVDIDGGSINGLAVLTVDNISINGNTITSTDTNGNLNLRTNGTGFIDLDGTDMKFHDGHKLLFGDSSDLQLYHDGSNSYIQESGTGNLFVRASNLVLADVDGTQYLRGTANSDVKLYHNNDQKLATTSTGIDVTGDVQVSDDLIMNSDASQISMGVNGEIKIVHSHNAGITLKNTNTTDNQPLVLKLQSNEDTITAGEPLGKIEFDSNGSAGGDAAATQASINVDATGTYSSTVGGARMEFFTSQPDGDLGLGLWIDDDQSVYFSGASDVDALVYRTANATLHFQDSAKASFGTSNDLQIVHDGGNSIIDEVGTGNLFIRGTNINIQNRDSSPDENMIQAIANDAVKLFHDGDQKFKTTATGVDVTGTATMDGLTVDGNISTLNGSNINMDSSASGQLKLDGDGYTGAIALNAQGLNLYTNSSTRAVILGTNEKQRVRVASNGDISFYEDLGSTQKFFWDASAESLGIGTITPSTNLEIASTNPTIRFTDTDDNGYSEIRHNTGSLIISADRGDTTDSSAMRFDVDNAEAMRINSLGKVGISQTAPTALLHVGDSSNSLGGTAGNSLSNLTLQSDTSNTDSLIFTTERISTGTTWTSAAHKIQRKVDAVEMGYMQFGNNTTDLITFGKADTEFVRINSSGRVGINTSGPTSLFHIVQTSDDSSGGLNIRNTAGTNSVFIYQDGTQTNFDSGSSGTQAFKTQNIDRLNISQGGLIGINQPTPTARLHVNVGTTTNNLQGVLIEGSNTGIATGPDLALYRNSSSPADSDNIGAISFYGNNGAAEQTHYAMMFVEVNDVSDGSEDASIVWSTMDGGTLDEAMRIDTNSRLLVGKDTSTSATVGVELHGDGKVYTTANSATPLLVNRTGTEGALASFRYGNVAKGLAEFFDHGFQIQGEAGHSGISFAGNAWIPLDDGDRINNLIDLGHTSYKFDDVYATNPNIQTSDRNEKQDIESLTATEMLVAARLSRLFKTFRWKDAVAKKGNDARTHTGTIAQDVQAAFTAEGLDAGDYALFISSTWWEHLVDVPAAEASEENGTPAKDAYTRTDNYYTEAEAPEGATEKTGLGLRYSELLAFVAAYNEQRFASIEARLTALEG